MAIAFDNATATVSAQGGTSATLSHTTGSGSNRVLVVYVTVTSNVNVTGITYNGSALTYVEKHVGAFGTTWFVDCWYIIAPSSGTNNVVVTTDNSGNKYIACASYSGVAQSSTINAHNSDSVGSEPLSCTSTSTVDGCWGVMGGANVDASFDTPGTNWVKRADEGGIVSVGDANTAQVSAGSYNQTMPWTHAGSRTGGAVQAMLAPYVAPSANGNFLMFM